MHEAIGREVADYIVKPTSPRQVLSVVTRLLAGPKLRHERIAQDFSRGFGELQDRISAADSWQDWIAVHGQLVDWELGLEGAGEAGLLEMLDTLRIDVRRRFSDMVCERYPHWVNDEDVDTPPLSVDVLPEFLAPMLSAEEPVLLVIIDCLRLDQWRAISPLLDPFFEIEEGTHLSILPTATPFSRNAIFSGLFPDELETRRPGWYASGEDEGFNSFEDELLRAHVRELAGREVTTHYEKVFTTDQSAGMLQRLPGYLSSPSVTGLVFGFVDLLTHGRSESRLIWEVARDAGALRSLTVTWFERSPAFTALREAASRGVKVLLTTDHGSIHCHRPATVYARKDATHNLRYKFGRDLRVEDPSTALVVSDPGLLRLPDRGYRNNYVLCRDDHYLVYPTKLREYQSRYRDSFLHGGISPEEMILPVALLTPKS
jgi:hypothetical protein